MKTEKLWGKYRGVVTNNVDPNQLGRVQVNLAGIADSPDAWAMPCVPYAGQKIRTDAIPPAGINVWVEFERGDPDKPIWVGCFLTSAQT